MSISILGMQFERSTVSEFARHHEAFSSISFISASIAGFVVLNALATKVIDLAIRFLTGGSFRTLGGVILDHPLVHKVLVATVITFTLVSVTCFVLFRLASEARRELDAGGAENP